MGYETSAERWVEIFQGFSLGSTFVDFIGFNAQCEHVECSESIYDSGQPISCRLSLLCPRWSPVQSVEKILLSVVSMLAEPNDESAANVDASKMWREDRTKFESIANLTVQKSLGL